MERERGMKKNLVRRFSIRKKMVTIDKTTNYHVCCPKHWQEKRGEKNIYIED